MGYKEDIAEVYKSAIEAANQATPDLDVTFSCPSSAISVTASPVLSNSNIVYASMWKRVFSFLIDAFLFLVLSFLLSIFFRMHDHDFLISTLLCISFYYIIFQSSSWQATIGQKILKIRIININGRNVGFFRVLIRFLIGFFCISPLGLFSVIAFLVSVVVFFFTKRRQSLHDLITRTVVVIR